MPERLSRLLLLLPFAIIWIGKHPYWGMYHDARLYTGQALDRIAPDIFGSDLFFLFGSQDAYTIFSPIYAGTVQLLGLLEANVLLLLASQFVWLVSTFLLARSFGRGLVAYLILAAIIAMPAAYGGLSVFSYGENFLTPRLLAEALVVLSLVALMQGRLVLAFPLLAAAFALHPLIGVPGAAVMAILLMQNDRRWVAVMLAAVTGVLVMAILGVGPLRLLLTSMDAAWLSLVERRTPAVFPTLWDASDWGALAADASLVAASALLFGGRRRQLMSAVLIASIAGVTASVVGGDLLKSTLIVQLQLWRATWLLHLMSFPAIVLLVVRLRHYRPDGWAILLLLLSGWATSRVPVVGPFLSATALALTFARLRRHAEPFPRRSRLIVYGLATTIAIAWLSASVWMLLHLWQAAERNSIEFLPATQRSTLIGVIVVMLTFLTLRSLKRKQLAAPLVAMALALPLVVVNWDQRSYGDELMGASPNSSIPSFQELIGPKASVFWPDHPSAVWVLLHRTSYASALQGVGIVFSHDTALEWGRRMREIAPLRSDESIDARYELDDCEAILDRPNVESLGAVCREATGLSFLVLPYEVPGLTRANWHAPRETRKLCKQGGEIEVYRRDRDFFLYDCSSLSMPSDASTAATR